MIPVGGYRRFTCASAGKASSTAAARVAKAGELLCMVRALENPADNAIIKNLCQETQWYFTPDSSSSSLVLQNDEHGRSSAVLLIDTLTGSNL